MLLMELFENSYTDKFMIGDRVRHRESGQVGTVKAYPEGNEYPVEFEDDGEIYYTEADVLELYELQEGAKIAWAKVGDKVIKKYRCTSGKKQGRIVNNPSDCGKPLDIKKKQRFKITRKAKAGVMSRKSKRTKSRNPASRRVAQLNQ